MKKQLIEIYEYCEKARGSKDYVVYESAKQMLMKIEMRAVEYEKAIDKICEILNL